MTDNANPGAGAGGGGTPAAWHNGVDAGIISAWQNKGYDLADPKAFATKMWESYSNLESHLGVPPERLVRLPKDTADADGWNAVHQRLGAPKEAKDYDFAGIKFSDGADLDDNFKAAMQSALHKAHVSKDTAPEVVKAVIKYFDDADQAETTARLSTLNNQKETLKTSWGARHDENLLQAKQGARRLGIDPETVSALEGVMGYDKIMEMFRRVGAGSTEDTFVEGRGSGTGNGVPATQGAARARMAELQKDQAWVDRLYKGDASARREFDSLNEMIAGVTLAEAMRAV